MVDCPGGPCPPPIDLEFALAPLGIKQWIVTDWMRKWISDQSGDRPVVYTSSTQTADAVPQYNPPPKKKKFKKYI